MTVLVFVPVNEMRADPVKSSKHGLISINQPKYNLIVLVNKNNANCILPN